MDNQTSPPSSSSAAGAAPTNKSVYEVPANPNDNLRHELASLKADLDALISRTANLTDKELGDAYQRLMDKFNSLRSTAKNIMEQTGRQITQGVHLASDCVKGHPLQAISIAASIGFVIGLLINNRR